MDKCHFGRVGLRLDCQGFLEYSPEDISLEDYSPGTTHRTTIYWADYSQG